MQLSRGADYFKASSCTLFSVVLHSLWLETGYCLVRSPVWATMVIFLWACKLQNGYNFLCAVAWLKQKLCWLGRRDSSAEMVVAHHPFKYQYPRSSF